MDTIYTRTAGKPYDRRYFSRKTLAATTTLQRVSYFDESPNDIRGNIPEQNGFPTDYQFTLHNIGARIFLAATTSGSAAFGTKAQVDLVNRIITGTFVTITISSKEIWSGSLTSILSPAVNGDIYGTPTNSGVANTFVQTAGRASLNVPRAFDPGAKFQFVANVATGADASTFGLEFELAGILIITSEA
jgi:hypothetical protein